jgi:hypothetical protein
VAVVRAAVAADVVVVVVLTGIEMALRVAVETVRAVRDKASKRDRKGVLLRTAIALTRVALETAIVTVVP